MVFGADGGRAGRWRAAGTSDASCRERQAELGGHEHGGCAELDDVRAGGARGGCWPAPRAAPAPTAASRRERPPARARRTRSWAPRGRPPACRASRSWRPGRGPAAAPPRARCGEPAGRSARKAASSDSRVTGPPASGSRDGSAPGRGRAPRPPAGWRRSPGSPATRSGRGTVLEDPRVPDLPRARVVSRVEMPIDDDAGADALAHLDHDHGARGVMATEGPLAHGRRLRVVDDDDRQAREVRQPWPDGHVAPLQADGPAHRPAGRVDEPGRADAHPGQRLRPPGRAAPGRGR